jgi:hypothetical protein
MAHGARADNTAVRLLAWAFLWQKIPDVTSTPLATGWLGLGMWCQPLAHRTLAVTNPECSRRQAGFQPLASLFPEREKYIMSAACRAVESLEMFAPDQPDPRARVRRAAARIVGRGWAGVAGLAGIRLATGSTRPSTIWATGPLPSSEDPQIQEAHLLSACVCGLCR